MSKGKIIAICIAAALIIGGGAYGYHQHQLTVLRQSGAEALSAAVNLDDYREAEQKEVSAIIDEQMAKIETCTEQDEVDAVIETAKAEISEIKTDAVLTAEEEEARKKAEEEARRKAEEEEAARLAAEEAERQAAAAKASSSKKSSKKKKSNSGGCVGGDADSFW